MSKLREEILSRLDDQTLYDLHQEYPSLGITKEWGRRLSSYDLDTLDFLSKHSIPKDRFIQKGLEDLKYYFPWRIGVIYDYRTGRVDKVEIKIGQFGKYKDRKENPLTFTWLYSQKSGLLLREVISFNARPLQNMSRNISEENSKKVSNFLFRNSKLFVRLAGINQPSRIFDHPLPGDAATVFPVEIYSDGESVVFSPSNTTYAVYEPSVSFSPEALKLLKLLEN